MLGISWTEFLVILLVAICIVPAKYWPDVARFFARVFKFLRNIIWKISDFSENLQQRIDLEKPIDDLIQNATDDIFGDIKKPRKKTNKKAKSRK